jgi:HSP20 family molecular chaperone IbpA
MWREYKGERDTPACPKRSSVNAFTTWSMAMRSAAKGRDAPACGACALMNNESPSALAAQQPGNRPQEFGVSGERVRQIEQRAWASCEQPRPTKHGVDRSHRGPIDREEAVGHLDLRREVLVMTLIRFEPLGELNTIQTEMNRMFNTLFDQPPRSSGSPAGGGSAGEQRWIPPMDLVETPDHDVVRADLPGVREDDLSIQFEDHALTISGQRTAEHEPQEGYYRLERSFGAFSRPRPRSRAYASASATGNPTTPTAGLGSCRSRSGGRRHADYGR